MNRFEFVNLLKDLGIYVDTTFFDKYHIVLISTNNKHWTPLKITDGKNIYLYEYNPRFDSKRKLYTIYKVVDIKESIYKFFLRKLIFLDFYTLDVLKDLILKVLATKNEVVKNTFNINLFLKNIKMFVNEYFQDHNIDKSFKLKVILQEDLFLDGYVTIYSDHIIFNVYTDFSIKYGINTFDCDIINIYRDFYNKLTDYLDRYKNDLIRLGILKN